MQGSMSLCVTDEAPNFADPFFVIETACTAWFTLDKTQCCRRRVVVLVLQLRCCVHLRSFTIPSFNGSRSFSCKFARVTAAVVAAYLLLKFLRYTSCDANNHRTLPQTYRPLQRITVHRRQHLPTANCNKSVLSCKVCDVQLCLCLRCLWS